ncbi:MAG: DUF1080 domain-containing protein [Verrucomicrobiae bacterium]|nr:DUF1080 domain-containing protein [Verrucomicrobiae bacterium]
MNRIINICLTAFALTFTANLFSATDAEGFTPLFPENGIPEGWRVTTWNDLSKPQTNVIWRVENGILHGSKERGSWLISEREYGDFILEFEFKLGELGNSGCALRAPMKGDPAFEGMELQMADYRYNTQAKDSELTGGIYRAIAPRKQIYKPTEWNKYHIELKGNNLKVILNNEVIHDLDLSQQNQEVKRHDGTIAPPIKDRPKRGHIGFQELSRDTSRVQIRNARIKILD